MVSAPCHSDRKHYGKGLCKKCYMHGWNVAHPHKTSAAYLRSYYKQNIVSIKARSSVNRAASRKSNERLLVTYLEAHPCIDCGEKDIVVLEFDHVRGVKRADIAQMKSSYTSKSILLELAKCEVRCANCHRRKTARTFGSYRLQASVEAIA